MCGEAERQATLMLWLTPDSFVPKDCPLRRLKPQADSVLRRISPFGDDLYAAGGRPSIPPEHLLKSSLSEANQLPNRVPYVGIRRAPLDQCVDTGVSGALCWGSAIGFDTD